MAGAGPALTADGGSTGLYSAPVTAG